MPGPVSDSYDPEYSTGANRHDVKDMLRDVLAVMNYTLPPELKDIVAVAQGEDGDIKNCALNERHRRAIRFAINKALEDM